MKTLYITDLDGTFLDSDANLTDRSKELINKAISAGADFTLATARTFATVNELFSGVRLRLPMVLMNGVMIYDPKKQKVISCHSIDGDSAKKIIDIYNKYGISPLVYYFKEDCLEIVYSDTDNQYQMSYVNKRTNAGGKRFVYSPCVTVRDDDKVVYLVTLDKYENIFSLYNEISKIETVTSIFYKDNYSDCYFLEIFAKGVSKASGLKEIKTIIDADKVIAFGDNLNDIEMFMEANESYAVSNACNEALKIATGVIGSNDEDSVATFILNNYTENNNG